MAMITAGETVEEGTRGMSKTEAIRAALQKDPGAMPKALAEKLNAMGFEVNPQHVSTIKNVLKREAEGTLPGPRGRQPAAAGVASPPASVSPVVVAGDISFESLRKAKELSAELGGIEKAKEALDALVQLTG